MSKEKMWHIVGSFIPLVLDKVMEIRARPAAEKLEGELTVAKRRLLSLHRRVLRLQRWVALLLIWNIVLTLAFGSFAVYLLLR